MGSYPSTGSGRTDILSLESIMIFGLVLTVFCVICLFLVLIILIQKGRGSMGLGNFGGSNTMLFGGSGGQNIFEKITWVLGAVFMIGSLVLAIMKTTIVKDSRYVGKYNMQQPVQPVLNARTDTIKN